MKTIIHKLFFAWEYQKEENWLNDMSARGMQLEHVGFCKYIFRDGEPNEYTYRIEMMEHMPRSERGMEYIRFVEETGAELTSSYFRWAYFRKRTADGPFELFSDMDSRIVHLNRLGILFKIVGSVNIIVGLANVSMLFGQGFVGNGGVGFINIFLGALLFYGVYIVRKKKSVLKKERELHE